MKKLQAEQHICNCQLKQSWWLVLLAVLFQTFYITSASASPSQTAAIFPACTHLSQSAHHDAIQCMKHCASATDNYTQNYISDKPGSGNLQSDTQFTSDYFHLHNKSFTSSNISTHFFRANNTSLPYIQLYLTTARLRI